MEICGVTVELCNAEAEAMITSSSPSLLGAETEVLPKGQLGFLSLMLNTRQQKFRPTPVVHLKGETTKGQMPFTEKPILQN